MRHEHAGWVVLVATTLVACVPRGGDSSFVAALDGGLRPAADAGPGRDASPGRDARVQPDASIPDIGGCGQESPPMNGTEGPINLIEDRDHGLPGCYRCGIDLADFDQDGRIDLVMAGPFDSAFTPGMGSYTYQNRARVYRNVTCPGGQIRFELAGEMPNTSGGGGSLAVTGDYNGDGRPDFAIQIREGDPPLSDTAAFMNEGGFRFTKRALGAFDTQSTSLGMARADLDRDGKDDLIFHSDAYGAAPGLWYTWNGTAFEARQTTFRHAMSYGGTIAAADLDGDEYPDLAVGGNSSQPFGDYDCSGTLLYGQVHFNLGAVSPGIGGQGMALGQFAMRADRNNPVPCQGMDNASMTIADMDGDGTNDIVIAGSADAFPGPPPGPPQSNGSHYDFVVLFNRDGTGRNLVAWENAGAQYPGGTTNGGTGNLDTPSAAVGDLDGDGLPEAFLQGHHRDYALDPGRYVFDTRLFLNVGGRSFTEVELGLPDVGEGGQVMADFNNDGRVDLIYAGASLPFHSNGNNPEDRNDASTIFAYVFRNTRP